MNEKILLTTLACPIYEGDLAVHGNSLVCERGHCFDVAAAGYANLASAKQAGGGDSKQLVNARTEFLSAGYY
jgi:23S rRNA (guanine745-N1)-methyltransferase